MEAATKQSLLMTRREAAQALRVSELTLRRWAAAKKLTEIWLGPLMPRYRREEIERISRGESVTALEVK